MRGDFLGGTSSTGGSGALTLTAAGGQALPNAALVDGQSVQYSIVEYTDSTKATISKSESGFGRISGSTLIRDLPRVTWNGTTYSQSSPAALTFGTTAANIDVMISDTAEGGALSYARRADLSANFGPNDANYPLNCIEISDFPGSSALTANTAYFVPVLLAAGYPITSLGVQVWTAAAAGKLAALGIFAQDLSDGGPGKTLLSVSGLAMSSTGNVYGSVTGRILSPGWYWFGMVSDGSPAITGCTHFIPGPLGGITTNGRTNRFIYRSMTYGAFGSDARASLTGSWQVIANTPSPIPIFK